PRSTGIRLTALHPHAEGSLLHRWFGGKAERWSYRSWRRRFVELNSRETTWFERHRADLRRILLSLVVIDENVDAETLRTLLAGVATQRFVEVEVCFAATPLGLSEPALRALLGERRVHSVVGGSSSRASLLKAALEACSGDHVVLAGRTALLPHASAAIAAVLARSPDVDLLYFDEELRPSRGDLTPLLKPGWSPSLLRRRNYVGQAFVVRRRVLDERLRAVHDSSTPEWEILKSFIAESSP